MSYVMANIRMPLSIGENGDVTPLIEYISIEIEKCDVLPEKVNTTEVKSIFLSQIESILSTPIKEPENNIVILPEEIQTSKKPRSQNITLKSYKGSSKDRNTTKRR